MRKPKQVCSGLTVGTGRRGKLLVSIMDKLFAHILAAIESGQARTTSFNRRQVVRVMFMCGNSGDDNDDKADDDRADKVTGCTSPSLHSASTDHDAALLATSTAAGPATRFLFGPGDQPDGGGPRAT